MPPPPAPIITQGSVFFFERIHSIQARLTSSGKELITSSRTAESVKRSKYRRLSSSIFKLLKSLKRVRQNSTGKS